MYNSQLKAFVAAVGKSICKDALFMFDYSEKSIEKAQRW